MFTVQPLFATWFGRVNLSLLELKESQVPTFSQAPTWRCAVDEKNAVIVFQLFSTTGEMRDGFYRYVLASGSRSYVFASQSNADIQLDLGLLTGGQKLPTRSEILMLTSAANEGVEALLAWARNAHRPQVQ